MTSLNFRGATFQDVSAIMDLISAAIHRMEQRNICQWDSLYPTREDFEDDINKGYLQVGTVNSEIVVVYAVNQEFDEEY